MERCGHCNKKGMGFKRCSTCKDILYCGTACQNADWKRHKKKCRRHVPQEAAGAQEAAAAQESVIQDKIPLRQAMDCICTAHESDNWQGVLKFAGRMEEVISAVPTSEIAVLSTFWRSHHMAYHETGGEDHIESCVKFLERQIPLLGELQCFWDQGEAMWNLAQEFRTIREDIKAKFWYEKMRKVGESHGFFSLESKACRGLGSAALEAGHLIEGMDLLRNALVAAELNELDDPQYEILALESLVEKLVVSFSFDDDGVESLAQMVDWEVRDIEKLVLRYRELTTTAMAKTGSCALIFHSITCSAGLLAVLCP